MKNIYLAALFSIVSVVLALPSYAADHKARHSLTINHTPCGVWVVKDADFDGFRKFASDNPGAALFFEYGNHDNFLVFSKEEDVAERARSPNTDGHNTSIIAILSTDDKNRDILIKNRWSLWVGNVALDLSSNVYLDLYKPYHSQGYLSRCREALIRYLR